MGFFQTKKTRVAQATLLRPRRNRLFRGAARETKRELLQERKTSLWAIGYILLWGIFLGSVVFALFFSSFLRIDRKDIPPTNGVSNDAIGATIDEALSGSTFGILPNDTMPMAFVRRRMVERTLLDAFPVFRRAAVSFVFPSTLQLTVEERTTTFVLCSGGPCFFVDEHGEAFDEAPSPSDTFAGALLTVVDRSAKPVMFREPLFSEDFLRNFSSLRQKLSDELGIETSVISETPSRFSDELWFRSREGWQLRMSATVPPDKSIRALRLLFAKTLSEIDRSNLDYIDLRTENRIFYLLKGDDRKEGESLPDTDHASENNTKKKK